MWSLNLPWKLFSVEITKESTGIACGLQYAAVWFLSQLWAADVLPNFGVSSLLLSPLLGLVLSAQLHTRRRKRLKYTLLLPCAIFYTGTFISVHHHTIQTREPSKPSASSSIISNYVGLMPKDIFNHYGFPPSMLSLCILSNFSFKSGQSYYLFETQWLNQDKTAHCFSFHDIWREITCLTSALRESRASGIEKWALIPSQPRFSKKIFQRWKINRLFLLQESHCSLSQPRLFTFFWQPYWQWQAAKILAGWAFQIFTHWALGCQHDLILVQST